MPSSFFCDNNKNPLSLAGVAEWIERQPGSQKVTGLVPRRVFERL